MRIVIFGAGAIGAYLGAHWTRAGLDVTLLGRPRVLNAIGHGYSVDSLPVRLPCTTDPSCLENADIIALTLKSTGLEDAIDTLRRYATPDTTVLSLLNGISPSKRLAEALPEHHVIPGFVPFNVVWTGPDALSRNGIGAVTVQKTKASCALAQRLRHSDLPLHPSEEIDSLRWGKLLLNLNNPINALSGRDLHSQLSDKSYRRIFAATLSEALKVLSAADIKAAKIGAVSPERAVHVLHLPDMLFRNLVLRRQGIRPGAQTSMAQDLTAGRASEIDTLNGDIIRLAAEYRCKAPVNTGLVRLMHQAENGGRKTYTAKDLATALGL